MRSHEYAGNRSSQVVSITSNNLRHWRTFAREPRAGDRPRRARGQTRRLQVSHTRAGTLHKTPSKQLHVDVAHDRYTLPRRARTTGLKRKRGTYTRRSVLAQTWIRDMPAACVTRLVYAGGTNHGSPPLCWRHKSNGKVRADQVQTTHATRLAVPFSIQRWGPILVADMTDQHSLLRIYCIQVHPEPPDPYLQMCYRQRTLFSLIRMFS